MAKLILFLSLTFIILYSASSDVLVADNNPGQGYVGSENNVGESNIYTDLTDFNNAVWLQQQPVTNANPEIILPTIQDPKAGTKGGLFGWFRPKQQTVATVDDFVHPSYFDPPNATRKKTGFQSILPWNWRFPTSHVQSIPPVVPIEIQQIPQQKPGWANIFGGSKRNDLSGLQPCWCINQPYSYQPQQQPYATFQPYPNGQPAVQEGNVRQVVSTNEPIGFGTSNIPIYAPPPQSGQSGFPNSQPSSQPPVQKRGTVPQATGATIEPVQPAQQFNFSPPNPYPSHQPEPKQQVGQTNPTQPTKH